jgi:hypothetical protein
LCCDHLCVLCFFAFGFCFVFFFFFQNFFKPPFRFVHFSEFTEPLISVFWDCCSLLCFCVCWFVSAFAILCVCVILLQFLQFLCVFKNFVSIFVAIYENIDFFQLFQFLCVLICLSFCCKSYLCQFLSQFLLQVLCVLTFVSVHFSIFMCVDFCLSSVAICECVDLSQFLHFLGVLICLRFLELFVVFWSIISLPSG